MLALTRPDGSFLNISESKYRQWAVDYPNVDISKEVAAANRWMAKNPGRAWKTLSGFQKWLERAQENAPKNQKIHVYVPAEESSHPSYRYEREHPLEKRQTEEEWERSAAKAKATCRHLREELGSLMPPEKRKEIRGECRHVWTPSFYGGGPWCSGCGVWKSQWLT